MPLSNNAREILSRLPVTAAFVDSPDDQLQKQYLRARYEKELTDLQKEKMGVDQASSTLNKLFQTGDPGRRGVEENFRKIFEGPSSAPVQGPFTQEQQTGVDSLKSIVPTLQAKTGIPDIYGDVPLGSIDKVSSIANKAIPEYEDVMTEEKALGQGKVKKGTKVIGPHKDQSAAAGIELRKEFINRPEVKDFITVNTQIKSMDSLLNKAMLGGPQNQIALDQALITMYNKLSDPSSVVRESEYARTPENIPIVNRISGAIQKIQNGGAGLTNEDRQALVAGAKIIGNERGRQYMSTRQGYEGIARKTGVDSSIVSGTLPEFTEYQTGGQTSGPKLGDVVDGYVFKGGNPADQNNWVLKR